MAAIGWEAFWVAGAVVLGLVLIYGLHQFSHRNRRNDPLREAATRELYRDPEEYERSVKPAIDRQIDRS